MVSGRGRTLFECDFSVRDDDPQAAASALWGSP